MGDDNAISLSCNLTHTTLFPGDTLDCIVSLHNKNELPRRVVVSAIQVYGAIYVDSSWVDIQSFDVKCDPRLLQGQGVGSLLPQLDSKKGKFIFSTPQSLLFCDYEVTKDHPKRVNYQCKLPAHLPPSYLGKVVRYRYFVVVSLQVNFSPTGFLNGEEYDATNDLKMKVTKIEFRILNPLACLKESKLGNINLKKFDEWVKDEEIVSPPIGNQESKQTLFTKSSRLWTPNPVGSDEYAISWKQKHLQNTLHQFYRKNSKAVSYHIKKADLNVGMFMLERTSFVPGEEVRAMLDFSHSNVMCHQVYASLRCVEEIRAPYIREHRHHMRQTERSIEETVVFTRHMMHLPLLFTIPRDCSPQFVSDLVNVEWRLYFEFITSANPTVADIGDIEDECSMEEIDDEIAEVVRFEWRLPISVVLLYYPDVGDFALGEPGEPLKKTLLEG